MEETPGSNLIEEEYSDNTHKLIIYGAATTIVVLGAAGYIFKDQIKNILSSTEIKTKTPEISNLQAATPEPEYKTVADTTYMPLNYTVKKGDNLWNILKDHFPELKDDKEITVKVSEIVDANSAALPHLAKDNLSIMEGKLVDEPDGIRGDVIYPGDTLSLGKEMVISTKRVSVDKGMSLDSGGTVTFPEKTGFGQERGLYSQPGLEQLTQSHYSSTITGYNIHTLYKGTDLVNGMNCVADYFNRYGEKETLDTFAFLNDDPEVLKTVLNFERSHGVKIKTNLKYLSEVEIMQSALIYTVCPNIDDALGDVEKLTGMKMSSSTFYRLLDMAADRLGYEGRLRKTDNPDLGKEIMDCLCS